VNRPRAAWRGFVAAGVMAIAASSLVAVGAPVASSATPKPGEPPRVIIDTDLSRWWDDATVLGIANVLQERGKVRVLGVVSDVPNTVAVAAIDAINTAYGHGKTPVGAVTGSDADSFEHGYTDAVVAKLPHSVADSSDVPAAVPLYRTLLAGQPDHSVTIVSLGGYTNLAGLLASKGGNGSPLAGRALVARKTKRLVIMDGLFPSGGPAFTNQAIDLAAASAVVGGDWPVPVAWVDGTTGVATKVGATLCTTVPANHPMRIVYESLFGCGPPGDGDWDAPAFLYAIGDVPAVFSEAGQGGGAVINPQGGLSWDDGSTRPHDLYVHVADQTALNQRIDQLLTAAAR
jgi:purine nucleosidase